MKSFTSTALLVFSTCILTSEGLALPHSYEFYPHGAGEKVIPLERNLEKDLTSRAVRETLRNSFAEDYARLRSHQTDSLALERQEFKKNKRDLENPATEAWESSYEQARREYEIR